VDQGQFNAKITIREASMVQGFIDQQTEMFRQMVEKLKAVGANVLICQKKIDDMAMHFLAQAGILAVQKSWEYEGPIISSSTGARMVDHLDNITAADLGYADVVEERKLDTDTMLFIMGCKNPKATTIFTRGANKKFVEEAERSIHDAVMVVRDVLQEPEMVVGGGAIEAEVSMRLMKWADTLEGREQLAAEKFAEALEQIPKVLAENAGLDPINTMAELRSKHALGGEGRWYGIPAQGKKVKELRTESVLEPLMVKRQVFASAAEAVTLLLRVDNVIALPPAKKPHMGEEERKEALKEGYKPLEAPSAMATRT